MELKVLSEPTTKKRRVINAWPKDIKELKGLTSLEIRLRGLTSLDRRLGRLGIIPPTIGELTNLRSLKIYGQEFLNPLPPEIGKLTGLKSLIIKDRKLREIPGEIGLLSNLTSLVIECEGLESFPIRDNFDLSNLRLLKFTIGRLNKGLDIWAHIIGKLTKLEILEFVSNDAAYVGQLAHPEKLIRKLVIPDSIGQLADLEELTIWSNLEELPETLNQLLCLRKIEIHNRYDSEPKINFNFAKLTKLKTILIYPKHKDEYIRGLPYPFVTSRTLQTIGAWKRKNL